MENYGRTDRKGWSGARAVSPHSFPDLGRDLFSDLTLRCCWQTQLNPGGTVGSALCTAGPPRAETLGRALCLSVSSNGQSLSYGLKIPNLANGLCGVNLAPHARGFRGFFRLFFL